MARTERKQIERELLVGLSTVNQHMGELVILLLNRGSGEDKFSAGDLSHVGDALVSLGNELTRVGTGMIQEADELDNQASDTTSADSGVALPNRQDGPECG